VFEVVFPVYWRLQRLIRAYRHRSDIGSPHVCFNAVVMPAMVGLIRREPGRDLQEQSLVGIGTGKQKANPPGIAQDHRTDLE
jgi:hypothetical protein